MDRIIEKNRQLILQIAERNGVTNVRVFGSMVRDEANTDSDVDLTLESIENPERFPLKAKEA